MSVSSGGRPKSALRRVERWAVGIVMAAVALALERAVMRSVRKKGERPTAPSPSTFTSKGGEVDLDEGLRGSS
jgi:hypothetical protein